MKKKETPRRSEEARNALVIQWQYLPHRVVNDITPKGVQIADREDAEQEGFQGLIHAAELWDESRLVDGKPVQFQTYAYAAIRRRVSDALRDRGVIHVCRHCFLKRTARHLRELGRKAKAAGSLPPNFDVMEKPGKPLYDSDEVGVVRRALLLLNGRERHILEEHIGKGRPLRNLAGELGVSWERVRQVKEKALAHLREILGLPAPFRKPSKERSRTRIFLTHKGQTRSISEWSKATGLSVIVIHSRRKDGWSVEDILETPLFVNMTRKRGPLKGTSPR